jgi:MFS family permease
MPFLTRVGLALVVDTVGEARTGQAMAYVSSAMSLGMILGPVLGGIIYDRAGYYAAFAVAFAIIGMDFVLRVILVEKKIAVRYTRPAASSEEENSTTIKLQALPLSTGPVEPSPPPRIVATESHQPPSVRSSRVPMVIRILKIPRLLVALILSFVQALILSAFDATLPLHVNNLFNFTSLQAGMLISLLC